VFLRTIFLGISPNFSSPNSYGPSSFHNNCIFFSWSVLAFFPAATVARTASDKFHLFLLLAGVGAGWLDR